jgi:hypothetical protein
MGVKSLTNPTNVLTASPDLDKRTYDNAYHVVEKRIAFDIYGNEVFSRFVYLRHVYLYNMATSGSPVCNELLGRAHLAEASKVVLPN